MYVYIYAYACVRAFSPTAFSVDMHYLKERRGEDTEEEGSQGTESRRSQRKRTLLFQKRFTHPVIFRILLAITEAGKGLWCWQRTLFIFLSLSLGHTSYWQALPRTHFSVAVICDSSCWSPQGWVLKQREGQKMPVLACIFSSSCTWKHLDSKRKARALPSDCDASAISSSHAPGRAGLHSLLLTALSGSICVY